MGKFRLFMETEWGTNNVGGEHWIEDGGHVIDAEYGDYNHEGYAQEQAAGEIASLLDVDDIIDEGVPNIEEVQTAAVQHWIEDKSDEEIAQLKQQFGLSEEDDLADEENELFPMIAKEGGVNDDLYAMAWGVTDARIYAMKHWGWKRQAGNNIETWTLNPSDIEMIASGISEIAYNLSDEAEISIYVYSTEQSHEVMWGDLKEGRLQPQPSTRTSQITPAQTRQATSAAMRNIDVEKLHPYYKQHGSRAESFPLGDWTLP
jgi:hypothetical protein